MKRTHILPIIALTLTASICKAQVTAGPYIVKNSAEFESPKKHRIMDPKGYGKDGIVQINGKDLESFSFQLFDNNMQYQKENTVEVESKFNKDVSFRSFVKFKNKTYLFVREVFKETKTEGITGLEFSPKDLDFKGNAKNLFASSDKVQGGSWGYGFSMSDDRTKFMYTYSLVPKEKRDKLNREIVGMQVFDENLNKIWGEDIQMPYTEAQMDNLGYTLSNDGKAYLLAKVFDGGDRREVKGQAPNYHFEVIVYQKGSSKPKVIEIKLETNFPKEAYIYEDVNNNIVITGFYGKGANKPVDGAYIVRLDVEKGSISKLNGGYYEIPSDIIKSFTSEREKRKLEKKEERSADNDIGIDFLRIRDIYTMQDGSTKIISEQYHVVTTTHYNGKTTTTSYDTYADDIFVMSVDKDGKLQYVKKIPKSQHSNDAAGSGLSINTMAVGNDLHIFYIDNLKNYNLPENEAPKRHENRRGGFLTACHISQKGELKKYNLGEIETYDTNFYIREFVDGGNNNLISTERKRKQNMLFSIEIK